MEKWERRDAKQVRKMPVHGKSLEAVMNAMQNRAKKGSK